MIWSAPLCNDVLDEKHSDGKRDGISQRAYRALNSRPRAILSTAICRSTETSSQSPNRDGHTTPESTNAASSSSCLATSAGTTRLYTNVISCLTKYRSVRTYETRKRLTESGVGTKEPRTTGRTTLSTPSAPMTTSAISRRPPSQVTIPCHGSTETTLQLKRRSTPAFFARS